MFSKSVLDFMFDQMHAAREIAVVKPVYLVRHFNFLMVVVATSPQTRLHEFSRGVTDSSTSPSRVAVLTLLLSFRTRQKINPSSCFTLPIPSSSLLLFPLPSPTHPSIALPDSLPPATLPLRVQVPNHAGNALCSRRKVPFPLMM